MDIKLFHRRENRNFMTEIDFEKGMHFVLDNTIEYDSLDFQDVSKVKNNYKIYEIINLEIDNEVHSFTIIGINARNIDNMNSIYEYTINCTELTKRLEKWFLTRDFSQPTVDDLEEVPYAGYNNRLKMVEEVKEFVYFVKNENKDEIVPRIWDEIDPETYEELAKIYDTDEIPSVTANNDTAKDVLDEIFSQIGAVARLTYDKERDKIILKAQYQNKVGDEFTFNDVAGFTKKQTINGYGNVANPHIQNVIGTNSLATNGKNGRSFTYGGNFADSSEAKIVVDYPIKEVKKLTILSFDNSRKVDITPHVIMKNQKQFLNVSGTHITGYTTELFQNNTIHYDVGGYEITGFGTEFEGIPFPFIDNKQTVFSSILNSVGNSNWNKNIQEYKYYIEYIPVTNEKVEIFKNNIADQPFYGAIPIVPQGNNIDFKRACNTLQDMIDKTGAEEEEIVVINEWYPLTSYDLDRNKIIVKKDCTLNNGVLSVVYTLTKESGYFNAFNSVDSMKRESAIEASVNRDVIVNDFIDMSMKTFAGDNPKSSLTLDGIKKFASQYTREPIDANLESGILIARDLNFKQIEVPILKTVGKDYAKIGFRANNPTNVGFKRYSNQNRLAVNYTKKNGTLENIGLSYGIAVRENSNVDFNKGLPEIMEYVLNENEAENLFEGTKLINLGDAGRVETNWVDGARITKEYEEIENGSSIVNWQDYFVNDKLMYCDSVVINLVVLNSNQSNTMELIVKGDGKQIGNTIIRESKNFTTTVTLPRTHRFTELTFQAWAYASGDQIVPAYAKLNLKFNLVEQQVESASVGQVADLTIKKNPNEILGFFHALNVVKRDIRFGDRIYNIVTSDRFITHNPLYNPNARLGYQIYWSSERIYDGRDVKYKNYLATNGGMDVIISDLHYIELKITIAIPSSAKSILIYDLDNKFLFGANGNAEIFNDNFYFMLKFTALPNNLILE